LNMERFNAFVRNFDFRQQFHQKSIVFVKKICINLYLQLITYSLQPCKKLDKIDKVTV
jgi:hypothetical protein